MKITRYIPYALLVILVLILGTGFLKYRALQKDAQNFRSEALRLSELYVTADGLASRRAQEIDRLKASNKELNNTLQTNRETIRSLTELTGTLQDSVANLATHADTIIIRDSVDVSIRRFDVAKNGFSLDGYFELVYPYRISFEKMSAAIDLEIVLSQNKNKVWTSYVTSPNPSFSIDELETKVNPYEPGFFEKIKLSAGAYGSSSRIGIAAGIWYDKHGLTILMDTRGGALGYQRYFTLKR